MLVRLLGAVEVAGAEGWIRAGPAKRGCVLAALALSPGTPVSLATLSESVWGADPPVTAHAVLYGHIARLRAMLDGCAGAEIHRSGSDGYLLAIDPEHVDVLAARSLAKRAGEYAACGRREPAAELWRRATELARGDALAGIDSEWAANIREGFHGEYLSMLDNRFEAELALGRHAQIVGELADLVARYPLSEPLVGHLMTALFRCGRQAEALECFAQARSRLSDRLGSDPSDRLRRLHRRILKQDPALNTDADARKPAAEHPVPAQLPAETAAFTGRDEPAAALCAQAENSAVLVVDGMAGVGKTALAVNVARRLRERYPDGQLFIDLHGFSGDVPPVDPADALDGMLRSLGVPDMDIPADLETRSAKMRTTLAGRRMLLVLDNAADSAQIRPLLPGDTACLTIVTSRRRLVDLVDARPYSLDVLDRDAAAALFVAVAGASAHAHARSRVVTEIAEACGRLPLALRVAASRLRNRPHWSLGDLCRRLSHTDGVLSALDVDSHGVAAAFDMSYRELDARHARLFRLLSCCPGPDFDVHAAAALLGEPVTAVEPMLEDLVDVHLLTSTTAGRYRFHDLLRQYAAAIATAEASEQERHDAFVRLVDLYAVAAGHATRRFDPHFTQWPRLVDHGDVTVPEIDDHRRAVDWFATERPNLVIATDLCVERGLDEHAVELYAALSSFLHFHGGGDRLALVRKGLRAARRLRHTEYEAHFVNLLGLAHLDKCRFPVAVDCFERALRLRRENGDRRGTTGVLKNLGTLYNRMGDYRTAVEVYERAAALAGIVGAPELEALARSNASGPLLQLGRADDAREHLDYALKIFADLGHEREEARVRYGLARVACRTGDFAEALSLLESVAEYCGTYGEPRGLTAALMTATEALRGLDRHLEAMEYCNRALGILREHPEPSFEGSIRCGLGQSQLAVGDAEAALANFRAAEDIAREIDAPWLLALAQRRTAEVRRAAGDTAAARALLSNALEYYAAAGMPEADQIRRSLAQPTLPGPRHRVTAAARHASPGRDGDALACLPDA